MKVAKCDAHLPVYTASELKARAIAWLLATYPDVYVVEELSLAQLGNSLIDVAAITRNAIIGIEIKGEGDSPSRLPLQGAKYGQACSRVFLLATPALEALCRRNGHLPPGWDYLTLGEDGSIDTSLSMLDYKDKRPEYGPKNCPQMLLEMLWKEELVACAADLRVSASKKDSKGAIAYRIAELVPLGEIRSAVIRRLRIRCAGDWQGGGALVSEKRIHTNIKGEAA